MITIASERTGQELSLPREWNLARAWGVSEKFVSELFATRNLYRVGRPYPEAVTTVRSLAEHHEVRIVTHKHGMPNVARAIAETAGWYADMGLLDLVDLVVTRGDKTAYPADVVIDDKPNLAWMQPDAMNLLMNRPWNQAANQVATAPTERFYRVYGWDAVLEMIKDE
jgi:5'(3')-deoxyribonucleotidase